MFTKIGQLAVTRKIASPKGQAVGNIFVADVGEIRVQLRQNAILVTSYCRCHSMMTLAAWILDVKNFKRFNDACGCGLSIGGLGTSVGGWIDSRSPFSISSLSLWTFSQILTIYILAAYSKLTYSGSSNNGATVGSRTHAAAGMGLKLKTGQRSSLNQIINYSFWFWTNLIFIFHRLISCLDFLSLFRNLYRIIVYNKSFYFMNYSYFIS